MPDVSYLSDNGNTYRFNAPLTDLPAPVGTEALWPAFWHPRYILVNGPKKFVVNATSTKWLQAPGSTFTQSGTTYTIIDLIGEERF